MSVTAYIQEQMASTDFSTFLNTLDLGLVLAVPVMAAVGILGTALVYVLGRCTFH